MKCITVTLPLSQQSISFKMMLKFFSLKEINLIHKIKLNIILI